MIFFCIPGPDDQNRWNRKNCPKFFHRVIFAFWIQICNPNLCKSHIFWITAYIEIWSFFAYPDLMTKIDEIGKIARNSFIGQFFCSEFKSATQIYVNPIYFELQLILRNDLCSDRILTCRIKSICSPAKGGTGCYRFNYQPGS